ncbi:MAG: hypothetical protein ACKO3W_08495, partial [bacterium]
MNQSNTVASERLPLVRLLEGGAIASLEIPLDAADELTTHDSLAALVRERGVLVDRAVDDAVHALAEQHAARKPAGAASGTTDEPCDADGAPPPTTDIIERATPAVDGAAAWIEWGPTFAPEAAAAPGATGATGATGAAGAAGAAGADGDA